MTRSTKALGPYGAVVRRAAESASWYILMRVIVNTQLPCSGERMALRELTTQHGAKVHDRSLLQKVPQQRTRTA